jgi:hypothetical protein
MSLPERRRLEKTGDVGPKAEVPLGPISIPPLRFNPAG